MKKIAIIQSNYIPWKGYFDIIAAVDEFVLFDDMQFTKRDWRNRNLIKTNHGLKWLTVPVLVKDKYFQKIRETEIDGVAWAAVHWRAIELNYRRTPYFEEIAEWLEPLYCGQIYTHISMLNRQFIESICRYLDIKTIISSSWDYKLIDGKSDKLADLCIKAGACEYITGPSAKSYIDENAFTDLGVKLTWFDYSGYPEYPQLWGDFAHNVTILDLLFNCGKNAKKYMKYASPNISAPERELLIPNF